MVDLIVRQVPRLGYLPLILIDGREVFRGEFWPTPEEALDRCVVNLPRYQKEAA